MEIRALRADDLDSVKDIRARAFGRQSAAESAQWTALIEPALTAGRYLGG
jgi:hypothetical protein